MTTAAEDAMKIVTGIDAARRVGWARAYSAEERLDEALRDWNISQGDRDAFRKGLSFMWGLFTELLGSDRVGVFRQALDEVAEYDFVLDDALIAAGRRRAAKIRDTDEVWVEEKELKRKANRQAANAHDREWKRAKQTVVDSLAARFGFQSVGEMEQVLARWQEAAGREPRDAKEIRMARVADERARRDVKRAETSGHKGT